MLSRAVVVAGGSGPCRGRPNRSSRVVLRDVSFRVVRLDPALGSAGSLGAVAFRGRRVGRAGRASHRGNAESLGLKVPRGFSARTVRPEPGRRTGELPGTTAPRSCSEWANRPDPVGIDRDPGDSSALGQGRRLRGSDRSFREGCGRSIKGQVFFAESLPDLERTPLLEENRPGPARSASPAREARRASKETA